MLPHSLSRAHISHTQYRQDPLTGALLDDAWLVPSGYSFSTATANTIRETGMCPVTHMAVSAAQIYPNYALRAAAAAFKADRKRRRDASAAAQAAAAAGLTGPAAAAAAAGLAGLTPAQRLARAGGGGMAGGLEAGLGGGVASAGGGGGSGGGLGSGLMATPGGVGGVGIGGVGLGLAGSAAPSGSAAAAAAAVAAAGLLHRVGGKIAYEVRHRIFVSAFLPLFPSPSRPYSMWASPRV